jgi:hypothetical protein
VHITVQSGATAITASTICFEILSLLALYRKKSMSNSTD